MRILWCNPMLSRERLRGALFRRKKKRPASGAAKRGSVGTRSGLLLPEHVFDELEPSLDALVPDVLGEGGHDGLVELFGRAVVAALLGVEGLVPQLTALVLGLLARHPRRRGLRAGRRHCGGGR